MGWWWGWGGGGGGGTTTRGNKCGCVNALARPGSCCSAVLLLAVVNAAAFSVYAHTHVCGNTQGPNPETNKVTLAQFMAICDPARVGTARKDLSRRLSAHIGAGGLDIEPAVANVRGDGDAASDASGEVNVLSHYGGLGDKLKALFASMDDVQGTKLQPTWWFTDSELKARHTWVGETGLAALMKALDLAGRVHGVDGTDMRSIGDIFGSLDTDHVGLISLEQMLSVCTPTWVIMSPEKSWNTAVTSVLAYSQGKDRAPTGASLPPTADPGSANMSFEEPVLMSPQQMAAANVARLESMSSYLRQHSNQSAPPAGRGQLQTRMASTHDDDDDGGLAAGVVGVAPSPMGAPTRHMSETTPLRRRGSQVKRMEQELANNRHLEQVAQARQKAELENAEYNRQLAALRAQQREAEVVHAQMKRQVSAREAANRVQNRNDSRRLWMSRLESFPWDDHA